MTNKGKKFTVNYNGEAINPGETMVPFLCSDLDVKNCVNKECIKTVRQGGKKFRVIYKAVPSEWAKEANSALNLVQNEELGHYAVPNSVSLDGLRDEYDLEKAVVESAEDVLMRKEKKRENIEMIEFHFSRLINANAKIGYAAVMIKSDIKGSEFNARLRLNQPAASRVRHQADDILKKGLMYFDENVFHGYKSKWDKDYHREAFELLSKLIEKII